jgi:pimeloyl-ACP methyl ester carboxylesterase
MPWIDDRPDDPAVLFAALRKYVEATWGKPEMKVDGRWQAVAHAVASELPEALRPLFFVCTGIGEDSAAIFESALEKARSSLDWLDPKPFLQKVRCPVDFIHGADDDVIPYEHAHALAAGLSPGVCRGIHVTGLYGHTHNAEARMTLSDARGLAKEAFTLLKMLSAVSRSGAR